MNKDDMTNKEPQPDAITKATKAYKILLGTFIAAPFSIFLGIGFILGIIALLAASLACSHYAYHAKKTIKLSNGTINDNGFIKAAKILPSIMLISAILGVFAIFSGFNMFGINYYKNQIIPLGKAVLEYAENHNGNLPELTKWCDSIQDSEKNKDPFSPYSSHNKNIPFALNMHLPANTQDIPSDMVLLFQSKEGWNQAGDHQLLPKNYAGLFNVFFADGHTEKFRRKEVKHLKWKLDDTGIIPEPNKPLLYSVTTVIIATLSLWFIIQHRNYLKRYWKMALLLAVLSALAGPLFGFFAEEALYFKKVHQNIGLIAGIPAGIITAICYSLLVAKAYTNTPPHINITGYATLTGAIAGILCSTIVHIFLMIAYKEISPVPILAGTPFGAWAGTTLGWITAGIINQYNKDITDASTIQTGGQ